MLVEKEVAERGGLKLLDLVQRKGGTISRRIHQRIWSKQLSVKGKQSHRRAVERNPRPAAEPGAQPARRPVVNPLVDQQNCRQRGCGFFGVQGAKEKAEEERPLSH